MVTKPISQNVTISGEDGLYRAKVNSDGELHVTGGGGGGGDINIEDIGGNPVTTTIPGALDVNIIGGGGTGGTASDFGDPFPAVGTAAGFQDSGGDMAPVVLDSHGSLPVLIKDSSGNPLAYNPNGQTVMANSSPVTFASNQSALPVLGAATPADNFANPTTAVTAWALNGVYDGANWDRLPGTTADGVLVNLGANNDVTVTGSITVASPTTIATGQVAPTGTAATLLAARAGRSRVTFENIGSIIVFIGPATVTSANGIQLVPGASITLLSTALVQAITSPSGTGLIAYIEEY